MSSTHSFVLAAVIWALHFHAAIAQSSNASCPSIQTGERTSNSTGSYTLPGLIIDSSGAFNESSNPLDVWTVTQFITRNSSNRVTVQDSFLNIPPVRNTTAGGNLTTPSSRAISMCERHFIVPDSISSRAPVDDGTCGVLITTACVRDLKAQFRENATALIDERGASTDLCMEYLLQRLNSSTMPGSCRDPPTGRTGAAEVFKSSPQGGAQQLTPTTDTAFCPRTLFQYWWDTRSNNSGATGLDRAIIAAPKNVDDYRIYDEASRTVVMYLFARMANGDGSQPAFADLQITCGTTQRVRDGSRRPASYGSAAAPATSGRSAGASVFVALAIATLGMVVFL